MHEIILATSNAGKILELQSMLAPLTCLPQSDFGILSPEETELSFIENALLKARFTSRITKKPALADDSGLVVPKLDGRPGIHSARFAGERASDEENINKLLTEMASLTGEERQAYFYCAIVFISHPEDPTPLIAVGQMPGYITHHQQGHGGFGYDPVMYLKEHRCTVAELQPTIKNQISHRAEALKQLRHQWFANLS